MENKQGFSTCGFAITVSKELLNDSADSLLKTSDDILVLIRYIDRNHCFAYVLYGPKLEPDFENQDIF